MGGRSSGMLFGIALAWMSVALAAPGVALAAWEEPVGGDQPINVASDLDASNPSLASVGGVPYVAWQESGGGDARVHVARLNVAGTTWEQVGGPVSTVDPIPLGGTQPSLTAIGDVPYVAWTEVDEDGDFQIHVARLSADETEWERVGEVANPAKPINESAGRDAFAPSLTAIEGVPYVAWAEGDGTNSEIRVARLNAGGTGWEQPVGGASPINKLSIENGLTPSLAAVDGVPYVSWTEEEALPNFEIRVARLNESGDTPEWEFVADSGSPINQSPGGDAREPSLVGIGGVPYVAWREAGPGVTNQVRVARLNDTGTVWEKVAGGAAPINKSSDGQATDPSLIGIDGVPYVAWSEGMPGPGDGAYVARVNADGTAWEKVPDSATPAAPDAVLPGDPSLTAVGGIPYVAYRGSGTTSHQTRVTRLEPELQVAAAPGATDATLVVAVEAFGLPYEVGFEFGESPGLGSETPTQTTSGDVDLITEDITGLTPSTTYDFRAFALAGVPAPRILGAGDQFTTDAAPPAPPDTSACDAAREELAAAQAKLKKAKRKLRRAKRGGEAAKIKKAKRTVRRMKKARTAAQAAVDQSCA